MVERFIGIMSGTSLDAVDGVLLQAEDERFSIVDTASLDMPAPLREEALSLIRSDRDSLNRACRLGNLLTEVYARCAEDLVRRHGYDAVAAIGCHGQTLRHFPDDPQSPFTVQVVNGAMLSVLTGIPCVTDFRRADIALGGQGAPLATAFHAACLSDSAEARVVLNLGGIANLTFLPPGLESPVIGFDTGPANALMDGWTQRHTGSRFDENGNWAAQGACHQALLTAMLDDPYFRLGPPKSTGREYFGTDWLEARLAPFPGLAEVDVQATLLELTARSITEAVARHLRGATSVYACGGGCRNQALMRRLRKLLAPLPLATTELLGIAPDHVEAAAFAWLAYRRVHGLTGNLPSVTGASRASVLGAMYLP